MFKFKRKKRADELAKANPRFGEQMTPEDIRRAREQLAKIDAARGKFEQRDGAA